MNRILENYVKEVLYAYPLLANVEKDYEEHIRNKAVLSYNRNVTAESAAIRIAAEILEMRALEWLKGRIEEALGKLDERERALIEIRYFGKRKKLRDFFKSDQAVWSERKYFRQQAKAAEKIAAVLSCVGVTKEKYYDTFVDMDVFKKIHAIVETGKDRRISADERRFMQK